MQKRSDIIRQIRREWPTIVRNSRCDARALDCLPIDPKILGASEKTRLGEAADGVLTAVVYFAPADRSGRDVCVFKTAACAATCLGFNSGRMRFDSVQRAQLWKTALRFGAPDLYFALLDCDIAAHVKRAASVGLRPAIRLDGTSDIGDARRVAPRWPTVVFYDYTKSIARALGTYWGRGERIPNWFVTYSHRDDVAESLRMIAKGINVAVPFDVAKGQPLPATWYGKRVIDGDVSDFRPGDPGGVVVGLRFKGPKANRAKGAAMGWAQAGER